MRWPFPDVREVVLDEVPQNIRIQALQVGLHLVEVALERRSQGLVFGRNGAHGRHAFGGIEEVECILARTETEITLDLLKLLCCDRDFTV